MNIYSVDLNLLKIFDAVHGEGSVSRAAARLGMTQPSVSHGLARLRALFGDPLFVRGKRGVTPTVAADRIAASVSLALQTMQATLDQGTTFVPATAARTYRFHMSDLGEMVFLPPLLRVLSERAPQIRLETRQIEWGQLGGALESGHLDFAIGYLPGLEEQFEQRFLFEEEYVEMTRRPTATRSGSDAEKAVSGRKELEYIAVTSHPPTLKILNDSGRAGRVKLSIPHFMVVPAILAEVDLAVILPRTVAETFLSYGDFVITPLDDARRNFNVGLYWHRRYNTDPGSLWMRSLIAELFAI